MFSCVICSQIAYGASDEENSTTLLSDRTGDGIVTYMGFGDSITFGVGDGTPPGQEVSEIPFTDGTKGYGYRLEQLVGVGVSTRGVPGEELADGGISRLPGVVANSKADIVGIFEGLNDARNALSAPEYERLLQKAVNVIKALGREPLLIAPFSPCCDHFLPDGSPRIFAESVQRVANANGVRVADLQHVWDTTCPSENHEGCTLVNLPEGLHPNTKGYTAIAQTIAATLLGVNLFLPTGAADLAAATGTDESGVVVKPDPAPTESAK